MKIRAIKDQKACPWVTSGQEYDVIGLDDEFYRIINDRGAPVLVPKASFDVVDAALPEDWIWQRFEEGEYYADPPELSAPGFYEDFFDGKEYAVTKLKAYLESLINKQDR